MAERRRAQPTNGAQAAVALSASAFSSRSWDTAVSQRRIGTARLRLARRDLVCAVRPERKDR